ncbi:diguanylate cyclase domain-containing protein [Marichromatium sp. AB31]|uniref:diguanylate cyclase domain-containing protein n=1 Tax=Marichromatium sp. AB31 TaxID=2483362 RepID=UPI000F3CE078|nr:diguanylate cyclase [Marichromatium sp. AB31]RNE88912.1 GGDEF domain-containing protein [Marichromatium sp. AB31]
MQTGQDAERDGGGERQDRLIAHSLTLFFAIFLAIAAVIGGLGAIFYQSEVKRYLENTAEQERYRIELLRYLVHGTFDDVIGDLFVLAGQNELEWLLVDGDTQHLRSAIADEYLAFSTLKGVYDQLRFLDLEGRERVRVNYNDGAPAVVRNADLQDKHHRYYFTASLALRRGQVYVSPFDLNIEHGGLERPLKPMIRLGTPVFDAVGNKRGVVLINYLGKHLLDRLATAGAAMSGELALLNADGYWMLSPRKDDTWGFMIPERAARRFDNDYPREWALLRAHEQGQVRTDNGLFTFAELHPLEPGRRLGVGHLARTAPGTERYVWYLVSQVPAAVIEHHTGGLLTRLLMLGAGVLLVIAVGSWYLALGIIRRRLYESLLVTLAHYDRLTGLPNRTLFFDRLERLHESAMRYGRRYGLLYLDLDGFKQVNDTFGHHAGDRLLEQVAVLLRQGVRRADTVARLGGDEFAILLSEVGDADAAHQFGNKLITLIGDAEQLHYQGVRVGASAGIAIYPDHASSPELLVRRADQAMYAAKKRGKNKCVVCRRLVLS